ncbi:MAG: hypothetical protein JXA08_05435 [Methanomicrobiaceae archaeon]|nr:hypothetical protein [Methanomicrobiaceae archaeon]
MKIETDRIKIGNIVARTGLSEKDVRTFAQEYDELLSYRQLGRVKLYTESAIGTIAEIARLTGEGKDHAAITREIGGGPGTRRVPATSRRVTARPAPASGSPAHQPAFRPVISPTAVAEMTARYEQQLKRLRARVETQEKALQAAKDGLLEARSVINRIIGATDEQAAITEEWITYFDARLRAIEDGQQDQALLMQEWIEYFEAELRLIKRPLHKRLHDRFR